MQIRFHPLWTVTVEHAFFGGVCDALEFSVPPATAQALAGLHAIARQHDGRLHVLLEVDEAGQSVSSPDALAGRMLHFGLRPRSTSFDTFSAPHGLPRGQRPWWNNALDPAVLGGPGGLLLSGPRLRVDPASAARPATMRVLTAAGAERAAFALGPGEEGFTLPQAWPDGEWRIEETVLGVTSMRSVLVDPSLAHDGTWGVLSLRIDAAHLAAGQEFDLAFAARVDTLRYYVVADHFSAAEFDEVDVHDGGFAAEGRPQIAFQRLLPAAFGPSHLAPALLDSSGAARIALFESQATLARRARGPTHIELQRNGDVLMGHLPSPGADRTDAQFVVHLSKP